VHLEAGDGIPQTSLTGLDSLVAARLRTVLLQAYLARIVILQTSPPPLRAQPGEHPRASTLARAQAAAGDANAGSNEEIPLAPARVEETLERFASLGLLQPSFIL
jgi:hypothetical protein